MGARATKAKDNVFYKARLEASRYNDRLLSRSGAAEALGYASESTISDWELGISIPTPEAILKMSDLLCCCFILSIILIHIRKNLGY